MHLFAQSMAESRKLRLEKLLAAQICALGCAPGCVSEGRSKLIPHPEPCTFGIEAWSGTGEVEAELRVSAMGERGRSLSLPDTAHLPPRSFPPEKEEKWTQRRGSRILSI